MAWTPHTLSSLSLTLSLCRPTLVLPPSRSSLLALNTELGPFPPHSIPGPSELLLIFCPNISVWQITNKPEPFVSRTYSHTYGYTLIPFTSTSVMRLQPLSRTKTCVGLRIPSDIDRLCMSVWMSHLSPFGETFVPYTLDAVSIKHNRKQNNLFKVTNKSWISMLLVQYVSFPHTRQEGQLRIFILSEHKIILHFTDIAKKKQHRQRC